MTNTAFSLQRTLLNTSAMSASPMESVEIAATGVSVQFGSSGAALALEAGGSAVAELDTSTGPVASELEEVSFGVVAELSGC